MKAKCTSKRPTNIFGILFAILLVVDACACLSFAEDNVAPTVATPARAEPAPVTGATTALSVLGADDGGEAYLIYTWSATTKPSGAANPTYSANGNNAAKNTTATFSKAGSYTFQVTIRDASGLTVTSTVSVTVNQTFTSIAISPSSATLNYNQTQQFSAVASDQFGNTLSVQPVFTWTKTSGIGSINATGLYTAPAASGSATIRAFNASISDSAAITIDDLTIPSTPTPTSTPTLEPSSTATPTAQPSPSPTSTSTPLPTLTPTPVITSSPTPVRSPTYTPADTTTPTATPTDIPPNSATPTPTPASTYPEPEETPIEPQVDPAGIVGVSFPGTLVTSTRFGTVLADSKGLFHISQLDEGKTYHLKFRLYGYSFSPDLIPAITGSLVHPPNSLERPIASHRCKTADLSSSILMADHLLSSANNSIVEVISQLAGATKKLPAAKRNQVSSKVSQLQAQSKQALAKGIAATLSVDPQALSSCQDTTDCRNFSYLNTKTRYKQALRTLLRTSAKLGEITKSVDKKGHLWRALPRRAALERRANAVLGKFPAESMVCY